jgi:hypothetical protein
MIVVAGAARASILIDDFAGGYFKVTITGCGNKENFVENLDRSRVYAGHRYGAYRANP